MGRPPTFPEPKSCPVIDQPVNWAFEEIKEVPLSWKGWVTAMAATYWLQ
jgi:hypothetical protein